ncbi:DDHD domain-containing protein [Halteromyces radiatus]|uniref:DDHD domain-containing protein n=1 Tax=Halteromyces radiatus TaxID=101107 RepID=UPI0022206552|nr:DDHD domain-containing protein [Halteromyces radiatus]KAI8099160.1 DDHD domain-containing protein [Halteromyces radiatus]
MIKKVSDHLVFFIHGMGQQYEEYGRLEHHVLTMQKNTQQILQQQYPNHTLRIQYVAIEWHSVIHDLVDTKMEQATLETVPKVRLATNHWLMDCLYYFSKPYGQCIIDTVCQQCNDAYRQHVANWPEFTENGGQVHMIGFSLGGVIGYDIASMQWFPEQDGPAPWHHLSTDSSINNNPYYCYKPDIHVPLLDFQLRYLFTCGSPVAAALVFRGLDYLHYRPPPRTKLFNVFHPFDPLGYRIEPMVNQTYTSIHPVRLLRAQRQRILPKIPNLGIRSSLANAKPLISKARRTFWQYLATISNESETEEGIITNSEDDDSDDISDNNGNDSDDCMNKDDCHTMDTYPKKKTSQSPFSLSSSSGLVYLGINNNINSNSMASPVLSTFSVTMHHSSFPLPSIRSTMKKLLFNTSRTPSVTSVLATNTPEDSLLDDSHITEQQMDTENNNNDDNDADNDDDDDDDDDYQSILSTHEDKDEDAISFFTASTFDPVMEPLSTANTSISTNIGNNSSDSNLSTPYYPLSTDKMDALYDNKDLIDDETKGIVAMDGSIYPRLDYVLTETVIDTYASEWIVAMKSHFKYWANRDLVLHMVNAMVNEI